ncbi:MAG: RlmE family RNA methyltransferase [Anaerolineae bacterium]
MPKDWRKQQGQDTYFKKAKQEGYRARSVYKLQEINERLHLIRRGSIILDLGAAPGSWSQLATQLAGMGGRVIAVDLSPIDPLPGVTAIQGDIFKTETIQVIASLLPNGADVVLSDVSPKISGIKLSDHARSIELASASLAAALRFLHPGGSFVVKVFQGEDFPAFVNSVRAHFETVKIMRPEASREESNEHYVVGLRMKANSPSSQKSP